MGFLSNLFGKSNESGSSSSPKVAKLEEQLEQRPKDTRLLLDLAAALRESDDLAGAVDASLRAARVHLEGGFHMKALAIAKQMMAYAPNKPQAYAVAVECYQGLKMKEDERGVWKQVIKQFSGDAREAELVQKATARIAELGPGR